MNIKYELALLEISGIPTGSEVGNSKCCEIIEELINKSVIQELVLKECVTLLEVHGNGTKLIVKQKLNNLLELLR